MAPSECELDCQEGYCDTNGTAPAVCTPCPPGKYQSDPVRRQRCGTGVRYVGSRLTPLHGVGGAAAPSAGPNYM